LRRLKSKGFKLIIITNQSGIGRGFFTVDEYRSVESEVSRQLGHGLIDATYFCPDVPGQRSSHRKPSPGMILQAKQEHQIDLARSFFTIRLNAAPRITVVISRDGCADMSRSLNGSISTPLASFPIVSEIEVNRSLIQPISRR